MSKTDRTKVTSGGSYTEDPRQISPEDRSPPDLDEAILRASRRAVRFHWLAALLEKLHLDSSSNWPLLVALAIGLLLGLGLASFIDEALQPGPSLLVHGEDSPSNGVAKSQTHEPASPERWLKSIASLVLEGRAAEAESELQAFRERYPDHRPTTQP